MPAALIDCPAAPILNEAVCDTCENPSTLPCASALAVPIPLIASPVAFAFSPETISAVTRPGAVPISLPSACV